MKCNHATRLGFWLDRSILSCGYRIVRCVGHPQFGSSSSRRQFLTEPSIQISGTGFRGEAFFSDEDYNLTLGLLLDGFQTQEKGCVNVGIPLSLESWAKFCGYQVSLRTNLVFSSLLKLLSCQMRGAPTQGWRVPDDWSHEDLLDELWFWQVDLTNCRGERDVYGVEAWRLAAYQVREPGLHYRYHHWRPVPVPDG